MNFYTRFIQLCNEKGVAPSRAVSDAGLTKAAASMWKKNPDTKPSAETIEALANYFNVSADVFLNPRSRSDDEALELLKSRPEYGKLLLAARGSSSEEIGMFVRLIKAAKGG